MKKSMVIVVLVIGIALGGDLLQILFGSALLSNWGSVILTGLLLGMHMGKKYAGRLDTKQFIDTLSLIGAITKVVITAIMTSQTTLLALVLIAFLNVVVINIALNVGFKLTKKKELS
ncbi:MULTISPECIES: hypothetical protein [unclassified Fusibacter]|uniref:hypothetical protein n=1 Tax=unclassified Fusibacter TaxID=2624464 RepID=UPI0010112E0E|nr:MULTISPECIES: hypothetical protein [unclassified Fusibacter]MCK8058614.1 hypothetical protein [Fusibacter sp. A2]NPE22616.1 hypothetical protein [Fusibacter sp. A1]RXV60181.1 hypothetical protein DWB64_12265 [Fusibacter sp. A1]